MKKRMKLGGAPLLVATAVLAGLIVILGTGPVWATGCPLEVTKTVDPEFIECDSGTDGAEVGDDCICSCLDTGTDGNFLDDEECIAEKVTYTIEVKNTSEFLRLRVINVIDDGVELIEQEERPIILEPNTSIKFIEEACVCSDTTNKVKVSAFGKFRDKIFFCTAEDTATVTADLECIDTGTDGH